MQLGAFGRIGSMGVSAPRLNPWPGNSPPVGVPTITGTATEGQTLTAVTSGISDADGLGTFAYQWLRAGASISGATSSTYTLAAADVGATIRVSVSYTDGMGKPESITSAATATVAGIGWLDFSVAGNYLPVYSIGM